MDFEPDYDEEQPMDEAGGDMEEEEEQEQEVGQGGEEVGNGGAAGAGVGKAGKGRKGGTKGRGHQNASMEVEDRRVGRGAPGEGGTHDNACHGNVPPAG